MDREMVMLLLGIFGLLALSSAIGFVLSKKSGSDSMRGVVANLNARIRAWWVMCAIFSLSLWFGGQGSLILFGLISFLAYREFITSTPTKRSDHRTLFWSFFLVIPLQYYLISVQWYNFFTIFIPVYVFLFIPVRSVLAGDTENFMARVAEIQWGLMVFVYCVSHAPALLLLDIPGYAGENAKLLLFLVLVVQMSDVLQYVFGKLLGKRKIVPLISPNKTWEGFVGGVASSTAIGAGLWWITPFSPWQAAGMALAINIMGFAGGLCMSAIKRDRGVKDFGSMIEGHGGMIDRIDSICFSAPIFFHLTRYFFTASGP